MKAKKIDRVMRDFFLGFVKIHILYHTGKRPFFGRELKAELEAHGYSISYGTLYPLLHKLCREEYLSREDRTVGGKVRKYYVSTALGRELLEEAKTRIEELVDEVMD